MNSGTYFGQILSSGTYFGQILNSGTYSLLNDELIGQILNSGNQIMNSGALWLEPRSCLWTRGGSIPGGRFLTIC